MAKERKWASECQIEGVEIVSGLQQKIKLAKEQHDVLKKCGLDREAKALLPKIQELEAQKLRLVEEIDRNRLIGAKSLLMCFCAAAGNDCRRTEFHARHRSDGAGTQRGAPRVAAVRAARHRRARPERMPAPATHRPRKANALHAAGTGRGGQIFQRFSLPPLGLGEAAAEYGRRQVFRCD